MGYRVDFHIHTTCSDGRLSPTEVVKQAKEKGYDMIAITDHDGIDGVKEALIAGDALDLKVVPGVELSTETEDGIGLHILGYYIDIDNPHLRAILSVLQQRRAARNQKLLQELNHMGYHVEMATDGYVGKPNIARALADAGYIETPKEAFIGDKIFGSARLRAIKKEKLQTAEAIQLIKEAGGIAVLAHPIQIRGLGERGSEEFFQRVDDLVGRLKKQGLKGLECYHPDHSPEDALRFVSIAEKYHLHITEGSDFHGTEL